MKKVLESVKNGTVLDEEHIITILYNILCGLQFLQQVSGINTVMYYGASIVQMAGFHSSSTAIYANVGLAGTNFLGGFVGVYVVEKYGRKPLVLSSLGGVVVALSLLGLSFWANDALSLPVLDNNTTTGGGGGGGGAQEDDFGCWTSQRCFECVMRPKCGFCTNHEGSGGNCLPQSDGNTTMTTMSMSSHLQCSSSSFSMNSCDAGGYPGWISVLLLVFYLACFAPGMGPMPWTINSEIYPLEARSLCVGIATSVNWITNLIVSVTFLTLIDVFTAQGAFWLYAGITFLGFIVLSLLLPETKGLRLAEVVNLFR